MRVTYTNYRFPFKEDLGAWTIIWDELSGSEGYVKLQATITPNLSKMLGYLSSQNYLNSNKVQEILNYASWGINMPVDIRTANIINEVIRFCESKKQIIKKGSYSWLANLDWGNTTRTDKCMKKIKKDLILTGEETLCNEMMRHLKSKNVL